MVKYWFIYESNVMWHTLVKILVVTRQRFTNIKLKTYKIPEGCRREKRGQVVIFEALSKSNKGILFLKIAAERWARQKIL